MAPPPPQASQPQGDNSLAALWITIFFFALLGVIWYVFHAQIVWFVYKVKYIEAAFLSIFTSSMIPVEQALRQVNTANTQISQLGAVMTVVGNYLRYPVVVILVILAGILFYVHPTLRFKRIHSMKTLYEQEKQNWPQVMPISTVNLVKEPIDKGPWAMSLNPLQFVKKYKLVVEEHEKVIKIGQMRERVTISLSRAEAYQVFAMQLGPYFNGIDKLNAHTRALFAVFASRINRDQSSAKNILDQLAISSVTGKLDFSGVDHVLNKYKDSSIVKKVMNKHAYVMTVMATMLETARQDGVLASADFLWLKLIDRPLWYMLNNVGRQTAFPEVAGPVAHWVAEKKLGRKISVPMVEEAVKALEIALKDIIYVPDKKEEA